MMMQTVGACWAVPACVCGGGGVMESKDLDAMLEVLAFLQPTESAVANTNQCSVGGGMGKRGGGMEAGPWGFWGGGCECLSDWGCVWGGDDDAALARLVGWRRRPRWGGGVMMQHWRGLLGGGGGRVGGGG